MIIVIKIKYWTPHLSNNYLISNNYNRPLAICQYSNHGADICLFSDHLYQLLTRASRGCSACPTTLLTALTTPTQATSTRARRNTTAMWYVNNAWSKCHSPNCRAKKKYTTRDRITLVINFWITYISPANNRYTYNKKLNVQKKSKIFDNFPDD